jgi:DNA-binding response OmpR family regulator
MRALVIEDDAKMRNLLQRGLTEQGYETTIACEGVEGLDIALTSTFDVIVLDLMLPRMDGLEIASRLRAASNQVPIVMLTGLDAAQDLIRGLNAGADDYLKKPFSFQVLLAHLKVLTRSLTTGEVVTLRVGDLVLDRNTHEVHRRDRVIALTRTEFLILECLMKNSGRAISRDFLTEAIWGPDQDVETTMIDFFIRSIQSKVDADESNRIIHTVRGMVYRIFSG